MEEVSYETLVVETWRFTFGGSLVRSARFGDLALHFWRTSRTKRSSWRLGASLLEEVLYEALVLETWRFTFGGSLVRNARFGDLALHWWSWTQKWPVCNTNVVRERAFRSWTQKWSVCSTHVVWERAFWRWSQKWPVRSTNVVRERVFWSWTHTWPVCSANVVRECDLFRSRATLCRDRACRGRNAGESAICPGPAQPFAKIVRVECAKCR